MLKRKTIMIMEEFPKIDFKKIPIEFENCFEDGYMLD